MTEAHLTVVMDRNHAAQISSFHAFFGIQEILMLRQAICKHLILPFSKQARQLCRVLFDVNSIIQFGHPAKHCIYVNEAKNIYFMRKQYRSHAKIKFNLEITVSISGAF